MIHPIALVCLALGTVAMVFSAVGLLFVHNRYDRLHFIAPAATLGMPLIGVAIAIDIGFAASTAKIAIIIVLTAVTSPIVSAATGFVIRRDE